MIVKPDPPPRRQRNTCRDKDQYRNKKYAASVASKRQAETGDDWSAYHCSYHHCWHVGHTPTRAKRARGR